MMNSCTLGACRRMKSVFTSKFNPTTGKVEWVMHDESYDYNQEIARSAYADMLHDTERNKKYEAGLQAAIKSMRAQGRPCNVLDIGTGTGLLSMMAVRNGADSVHACEEFDPAAKCAAKVIAANGMADKIVLIKKRSTAVSVPDDMPHKANILVTEVFDTELIGEGALSTFRHALEHLLEPNSIVVPSAARMYIQPVDSSFLSSFNRLTLSMPETIEPIRLPPGIEKYIYPPLFDLQLSSLPQHLFDVLALPQIVFRFDFCGREKLPLESHTQIEFKVDRDGVCHAFFMWWDLDMDMRGDVQLSCAPHWEHPLPFDKIQWRDHWMQAIFYPSFSLPVVQDARYVLDAKHDEYSLDFDISTLNSPVIGSSSGLLPCAYTRSRLAMLGNVSTISKYSSTLHRLVDDSTVVLCVSECSFLPYLLARLGAKKVYTQECDFVGAANLAKSVISYNDLSDKIYLYGEEELSVEAMSQVTLVVGEPYFCRSFLPWNDLRFWYTRSRLSQSVDVFPISAHLVGMAVQFDNLHKIRQPVKECEGFDLNLYDSMIERSREKSDDRLEQHSLWEYPCKALGPLKTILEFDFKQTCHEADHVISHTGIFPIECKGEWNGVALWMIYNLDGENSVSFGVEGDCKVGSYPSWNMERKQAVYLPIKSSTVKPSDGIQFDADYHVADADLRVTFSVS
ncbi:protein arginine N-methyltransferase 7-like isoform X2 [Watersipora subatra]|uniref:protein arginine N-methyltransferase 7-like isoform X2 n=1 Tax=Watersipora subatra TaxID=2589382 RepID=UPI00355B5D9B